MHLTGEDAVVAVLRRINSLSEMGFTHAIFNMPDVYKVRPLEILAKDVVTMVAERYAANPVTTAG